MLASILFWLGFVVVIVGLFWWLFWYLKNHPPKPGDNDEYNGQFGAGSPH